VAARELVDAEVPNRRRIDGTRHEHLLADINGETTYAERFAATWHEMEAAAPEPTPAAGKVHP